MARKKDEAKIKFTAETKDLQDEIKAAGRAIQEYNSQLRLNAEQMKTAGTSVEALEKRYQILQNEAAQYERKLEALNQELEKAVGIWGENSEEAEKLRIRINNTGVSLEQTKQKIAGTAEELSRCQREMAGAGEEADDVRSAYEKLTDRIQEQREELSKLEDAYKDSILQFGKGSDEAKDLEGRIKELSQELGENENAMDGLEAAARSASGQMDDLTESVKETGDEFTVTDGAVAVFAGNALTSLVGFAKEGASAIYNLADETREYRAEMAKLSSAAESNGYSTEFAKEKYLDMYEVLADETAANTTVSNFMAMKLSQEDMNQVLEAATGIWAKYGDSIPLDGLAESINETANVGQVTGNLADALNWAGLSEDDFNSRLSLCNDTQERQQLIIKTLNTKYGALAKSYKENNKKVMQANRASAEYNDTMAELGEEIEPVTQAIRTGLMDVVKATMEMVDADTDKAAEKIGDAFEWVAENIEDIVKVAKYGATALGTIFMINKAAEFAGTVKNVASMFGLLRTATVAQTVATEGQTVAQTGLNVAMNANPIGIMIAAGTALVGVLALINEGSERQKKALEEQIEKAYGLTEAQKALVGAIEDRNQSFHDSIEARANEVNGIEQEYAYCQKLVEELRGIVDENGKITEGNEDRAAVITGILSDALGIEIEITDGVIKKYDELNSTIEDVIRMKKAEAVLEAHKDAYTEATQEKTNAAIELTEALEDLKVASEKTEEAQRNYDEALAENNRLYQENIETHGAKNYALGQSNEKLKAAKAELEKATESEQKFDEAVKTANDTLNYYNAEIQNYEGALAAVASGEADEVDKALDFLTNSFITAEYASRESLEHQVSNMKENYENLKAAVENGTPGVTEEMVNSAYGMVLAAERELDKFDGKTPVQKAMDGAIAAVDATSPLLEKNMQNTVYNLEEILLSPDTYGAASQNMNEYAAGIKDAQGQVQSGAEQVVQNAKEVAAGVDFSDSGYNAAAGFAAGLSGYHIEGVAGKFANRALQALRDKLDINSPSKKTYKIAEFTTEGFTNAIEDNLGKVEETSGRMAQAAIDPINKMSRIGIKDLAEGNFDMPFPTMIDERAIMGRYVDASISQGMLNYKKLEDIFINAVSRIDSSITISGREFSRIVHEVI